MEFRPAGHNFRTSEIPGEANRLFAVLLGRRFLTFFYLRAFSLVKWVVRKWVIWTVDGWNWLRSCRKTDFCISCLETSCFATRELTVSESLTQTGRECVSGRLYGASCLLVPSIGKSE
jgi:hypothetical protein